MSGRTLETPGNDYLSPQSNSVRSLNRRVVATRRGGPDVLQIVESDIPEPKRNEVRVKILATGVSYADLLMREGVHPETPRGAFTLGWDFVGVVDKLGADVSGMPQGTTVAALPVTGGYADYICLRPDQLVTVPDGLDPAEAVSMVLNYMTAYQMLHRSAEAKKGQLLLIHGAAGGIGTALLQLGRLFDLKMYGTVSKRSHDVVKELGGIPIDYRHVDFVEEIGRLTGDGVDIVFDGIGGKNVWRSLKAVRPGGKVIAYGLTASLRKGRMTGTLRHRFHGLSIIVLYKLAAVFLPRKRKIKVYSIQRRMWRHPEWFREDLTALFQYFRDGKIKPVIAARMPLAQAPQAHELLAQGSVNGKIVLLCGS